MTETLVYNNYFNEFRGETAADVIRALYQNTHEHTGIGFEDWWTYQQSVWAERYGAEIPDAGADGACQVLMDVLIGVGALESGPKPDQPEKPAQEQGQGAGQRA